MDLLDLAWACLRRWYVILPGLVLTAFVSYSHYTNVPTVYYANSVVSVVPPNEQWPWAGEKTPVPQNGLLQAGGATLMANLAVLAFDASVRERVVAQGGSANYTVKMFPTPLEGSGAAQQLPLIMVESTQSDMTIAARTVSLAAAEVGPILRNLQLQAGVPPNLLVGALVVAPPPPMAAKPSRARATVAFAASGVGLTILLAVVVDSLLLRRRTTRTQSHPTGDHGKKDNAHPLPD